MIFAALWRITRDDRRPVGDRFFHNHIEDKQESRGDAVYSPIPAPNIVDALKQLKRLKKGINPITPLIFEHELMQPNDSFPKNICSGSSMRKPVNPIHTISVLLNLREVPHPFQIFATEPQDLFNSEDLQANFAN